MRHVIYLFLLLFSVIRVMGQESTFQIALNNAIEFEKREDYLNAYKNYIVARDATDKPENVDENLELRINKCIEKLNEQLELAIQAKTEIEKERDKTNKLLAKVYAEKSNKLISEKKFVDGLVYMS